MCGLFSDNFFFIIEHDQLTNEEDTISDDGGESVDDSDLEARVVPPTLDAMDMDASDTITTNDLGVPTIPSDQTQSAKQIIRLNTFIPNSSGTSMLKENQTLSFVRYVVCLFSLHFLVHRIQIIMQKLKLETNPNRLWMQTHPFQDQEVKVEEEK